jgi:hypothetical protein
LQIASAAGTLSEENIAALRQQRSHVGGENGGLLTSSVILFSVRSGLRSVSPTCQCRQIVASLSEQLLYVPCIGSAFDKTWQSYSSTCPRCMAGSGVGVRSDVAQLRSALVIASRCWDNCVLMSCSIGDGLIMHGSIGVKMPPAAHT